MAARNLERGTIMTVKELYASIDGNYDSAMRILMNDKLAARFIVKLADDTSFDSGTEKIIAHLSGNKRDKS